MKCRERLRLGENIMIFAGVDVGSTTGKALLLDDNYKILGFTIMEATSWPEKTAHACIDDVLKQAGVKAENIVYTVGTGYGRMRIAFANENISEITCHAVGAKWLCPTVRTVVDIGGQDCKVIGVRDSDGKVREFYMNDKCAAGTGRFMESQARVLGVKIVEFSEYSQRSVSPARISAQCSVFAESEVITQLNDGNSKENIIAGIHVAIAERLISLLKRLGIQEDLTVSGGCAKNEGLINILQEKTGVSIVRLKEDPQVVGALGAAVLAQEKWRKRAE
jgi:predicted CoA-substrate-specific enzyme activase